MAAKFDALTDMRQELMSLRIMASNVSTRTLLGVGGDVRIFVNVRSLRSQRQLVNGARMCGGLLPSISIVHALVQMAIESAGMLETLFARFQDVSTLLVHMRRDCARVVKCRRRCMRARFAELVALVHVRTGTELS